MKEKLHDHQVDSPLSVQEWKDGGRAPIKMSRRAAVVDRSMSYFMHQAGQVHSYSSTNVKEWNKLPTCPSSCSSLAVTGGLLTAIVGENRFNLKCSAS